MSDGRESPSFKGRYASLDWTQGGGNITPQRPGKEETLPEENDSPTNFFNSRMFIGTLPAKGRTPQISGWLSRFFRRSK